MVDFDTYNQYKANLHTHTDQSDGAVGNTVQAVAEAYSNFGYDVLAITDHDTYPDLDGIPTWALSDFSDYEPSVETAGSNAEYYPDLSLLMIKGNELSGNPTTVHHRGALFCDIWTAQQISDGDFATYRNDMAWTLAKINEMGGLSILNHPNYHTGYDLAFYTGLLNSITNLLGIEIYNGQVAGDNEDLWDEILVAEMPTKNVWGLSATDDHTLANQCGKQYCIILTDELTGDKIKSALQNGHFYFVHDPLGNNIARHNPVVTPIINNITINADKNIITIDASNSLKTEWIYNGVTIHEGNVFNPRSNIKYVRAKLTGINGSLTFTQAFGIALNS